MPLPSTTPPRTAAACVLALTAAVGSASAQVSYRTVVLSGQAAPGMPEGSSFSNTLGPLLSHSGQTAFFGFTTGPTGSGNGIWSEGSGPLSLVARSGGPAPGLPAGTNYLFPSTPMINAAGHVAFHSQLNGLGISGDSIWTGPSDAPALLVRTGDAVPGMPAGTTFGLLSNSRPLALNEAGEVAFIGTASAGPGTSSRGIWAGNQDSLRLVAHTGAAAPGTPAGVTFNSLGPTAFDPLVLNAAGRTIFTATLAGPDVTGSNNWGIWSDAGGALSLVARGGDAAPGTAPGTTFSFFESPVINAAGQVAFLGNFTGPGASGRGIWSGGIDAPSLIARTGDAAPGMPDGTTFSSLSPAGLNSAGQVAFHADVTGPQGGGDGIWIGDQSSLSLVARFGEAAPGTSPTTMFYSFYSPSSNDAGQVAFLARLFGSDISTENNFGIWVTDPSGSLTLIVRTGDLFDVNDDPEVVDLRTVSHLAFNGAGPFDPGSGGEDGRPIAFNDLGQLAFRALFTDGSSGIFVATIPAPSAAPLLPLAALLALRRRR